MNIVITSASDIKLTQYESSTTYRIEDIKVRLDENEFKEIMDKYAG